MKEVFVITISVTVSDLKYPEVHPIHRHQVYGVASSEYEAGNILRSAISNSGFKTSHYDTRIRETKPVLIHDQRHHVRDLLEEYEWMVERKEVDFYETN